MGDDKCSTGVCVRIIKVTEEFYVNKFSVHTWTGPSDQSNKSFFLRVVYKRRFLSYFPKTRFRITPFVCCINRTTLFVHKQIS